MVAAVAGRFCRGVALGFVASGARVGGRGLRRSSRLYEGGGVGGRLGLCGALLLVSCFGDLVSARADGTRAAELVSSWALGSVETAAIGRCWPELATCCTRAAVLVAAGVWVALRWGAVEVAVEWRL